MQEWKMTKLTDKKLLKLWGRAVIEHAGCKCEYPDCNINYTQLHPHHLFSRRHASLRYEIRNGVALCSVHHSLGSFSAHNDPTFKDRLVACGVRPLELFEELSRQRNRIQKNTTAWKQECYEKLKAYL